MVREMKDSGIQWIGEIPADWLVLPVKSFYNFETGFTPPTEKNEYYCDDGEVWITISDLTQSTVYESQTKIQKEYAKEKGTLHKEGSLLYSFKLSVGKKAILGCNAYTNEAIAVFDARNNPCIQYLYYSIDLVEFNSNENIYGAKLLNRKLIQNAPIVFPPLSEQNIIASFLDSKCSEIDKAIEATKASIEEYKKLRQAIITEAVTKGLDPDVEMKDSGIEWIGEIPKHWDVTKIGKSFSLRNEKNYKSEDETKLLSLYTGRGVFPTGDEGTINSGNHAQTVVGYKVVKKDDIVVNIILAWMGAIGISEYDGVVSPAYDVYIPNKNIACPRFCHYLFRTTGIANECYRYGRGIMMMRWRTYSPEFKQIIIPLPPIREQMKIASYLDTKCSEIDSLIKSKEKLIEELTAYRKSLIYEYVTGKKEVPAV